jgi:hypothetical protein
MAYESVAELLGRFEESALVREEFVRRVGR